MLHLSSFSAIHALKEKKKTKTISTLAKISGGQTRTTYLSFDFTGPNNILDHRRQIFFSISEQNMQATTLLIIINTERILYFRSDAVRQYLKNVLSSKI